MNADSLDSLIPSNPMLAQNAEMLSAPHKLLHLDHSFLQHKHKLSLMKTFVSKGMLADSGFKFFVWFLFSKILQMSLRQFNFMMTSSGVPFEGEQLQSSTKLGSIGTSLFVSVALSFHCHESVRQFSIYISSNLYSRASCSETSDFKPD